MIPLPRRVTTVSAAVLGAILLTSCDVPERLGGPQNQRVRQSGASEDIRAAVAAQGRATDALMRIKGVVGTAVGLRADGQATIQVMVVDDVPRDIPAVIENIPVQVRVTGMIVALSDPTTRMRPAPVGFSVGHPAITAGTIGARVVNGTGVYALSNNHVLANGNAASIGDAALQPGPFDGGTAADQIGTLFAFAPISFTTNPTNTIDAAIAISNVLDLDNSTPLDDGYGTPNAAIFGDANSDGVFDDRNALLGVAVQKFGRTTKLTHGTITGINATVDICYEVIFIFCIKSARFVDQLIITPAGFSGGGDSGSLIVSDDGGNNPVGLLFAGSSTETIANRIDLVLNYFNVSIDGSAAPPPTPLTDVAVTSVTAPASVTQGATVNVSVQVRNVGNQSVGGFDVTLRDQTDDVPIGTQSVAGLSVGGSATLTYSWNTASSSLGSHTLAANHTFADENAANDQATTTVQVNAFVPSVEIHVGDLDGFASNDGNSWSATVEITVHDANHLPLNGATIVGAWNVSGLNSNTCTSGDLGGTGTCIVLFPGLGRNRKFVTFTVNSVTMGGKTYQSSQNHDPDGSSNGTTQRVNKP